MSGSLRSRPEDCLLATLQHVSVRDWAALACSCRYFSKLVKVRGCAPKRCLAPQQPLVLDHLDHQAFTDRGLLCRLLTARFWAPFNHTTHAHPLHT